MMDEKKLIDKLRESSRETGVLAERQRIVQRLHHAFRTNPEATYSIEGILDLLFTPNWRDA